MACAVPAAPASAPISIVVHGGAWRIPEVNHKAAQAGTQRAAAAGYRVLSLGGSAVDAVEAAVRVLEDDPVFDAGTGSVLNSAGCVEMDALLCRGSDLRSGAIVGVDCVRHPISVARNVMERTPHAMLAGDGAKLFARECGEEVVDPCVLVTAEAAAEWRNMKSFGETLRTSFRNIKTSPAHDTSLAHDSTATTLSDADGRAALSEHDTVGAAAVDVFGHVASGTSTGGITMKLVGRVGDSPLIGCGAYADDLVGAASTTGHGESIMRVMLARHAVDAMAHGRGHPEGPHASAHAEEKQPNAAQRAAAEAIAHMRARVDGFGGVIVLSHTGDVGVAHNTVNMAWAAAVGRVSTMQLASDAVEPVVLAGGIDAADGPHAVVHNDVHSAGLAAVPPP